MTSTLWFPCHVGFVTTGHLLQEHHIRCKPSTAHHHDIGSLIFLDCNTVFKPNKQNHAIHETVCLSVVYKHSPRCPWEELLPLLQPWEGPRFQTMKGFWLFPSTLIIPIWGNTKPRESPRWFWLQGASSHERSLSPLFPQFPNLTWTKKWMGKIGETMMCQVSQAEFIRKELCL